KYVDVLTLGAKFRNIRSETSDRNTIGGSLFGYCGTDPNGSSAEETAYSGLHWDRTASIRLELGLRQACRIHESCRLRCGTNSVDPVFSFDCSCRRLHLGSPLLSRSPMT